MLNPTADDLRNNRNRLSFALQATAKFPGSLPCRALLQDAAGNRVARMVAKVGRDTDTLRAVTLHPAVGPARVEGYIHGLSPVVVAEPGETEASLASRWFAEAEKIQARVDAETADPWARLQTLLGRMDWSYTFSDDGGVFLAGERTMRELRDMTRILAAVDVDRVRALWAKTNTLGLYPCPV